MLLKGILYVAGIKPPSPSLLLASLPPFSFMVYISEYPTHILALHIIEH